jgi:hypothetical protein
MKKMDGKWGKKLEQRGESPSPAPPRAPEPAPRPAPRKKDEAPESPDDYSDPICVCEPEPYWQEIAERLKQGS